MSANDGETVAKLATQGHGICYLPSFLTHEFIESGALIPVLREFEFDPLPVSLVFPANRLMNPALRALIEMLLQNKPAKEQFES